MSRVNVAGDSVFREKLESQGFIPTFRWKEGTYHECAILKVATKPDGEEFYTGLMPSWVLFEELAGAKVQINQVNKIGEYNYDPTRSFEDNIAGFIVGKTYEEACAGQVNEGSKTDLETLVSGPWISANYYDEVPRLREMIGNNDRLGVFNWVKEKLPEIKTKFIKTRTQLLVPSGIVVSTKVNDTFRNGTLEDTKETIKTVNKYYKLTDAIMRDKFKVENSGVGLDTEGVDSKEIRNKYRTFLFRKGEPLTRPKSTGIIFMATREIMMFNDDWQPKMDENKSIDFKLEYYTLNSKSKYNKINSRRVTPGVDTELDYVMVRFEYEGSDKTEAGRNMSVAEHKRKLEPKEVFQTFLPALPDSSYNKCFELQKYPLEDVIAQVTVFINSNNEHLQNLSGEERERIGDSLDLIKGNVNTDTIDDVLNEAAQSFQQGLQQTKSEVDSAVENAQLNNQIQQNQQQAQPQVQQSQQQAQPQVQQQTQQQGQQQQPQWNQNNQQFGQQTQQFGQQQPQYQPIPDEMVDTDSSYFNGVNLDDFQF